MNPYPYLFVALLTFTTLAHGEAQAADSNTPAVNTSGGDYLGAVGIGVSDLEASAAFYSTALGLEVLRTYELGYLDEIVLGYPDGAGTVLVLMNWPGDTERRYDGITHHKIVDAGFLELHSHTQAGRAGPDDDCAMLVLIVVFHASLIE